MTVPTTMETALQSPSARRSEGCAGAPACLVEEGVGCNGKDLFRKLRTGERHAGFSRLIENACDESCDDGDR